MAVICTTIVKWLNVCQTGSELCRLLQEELCYDCCFPKRIVEVNIDSNYGDLLTEIVLQCICIKGGLSRKHTCPCGIYRQLDSII